MKQVIVLRKDLNMRKGKMVAQGAHASMAAILAPNRDEPSLLKSPNIDAWLQGSFTKICVSVGSEQELLDIYEKAQQAGLHCSLIKDSGRTEFSGVPTYTAVAVGPNSPEDVDRVTGHLILL